MKFSQFFAPTLRDDPADAEVISHKLLLRAGYIRRVTSGVYDFLPLGLKVLRKIETIIREEMNRAGAQELLMPTVQPSELWQKSGRWEKYGPELLRFDDRHQHASCLGPTHEEVICDLISRELRSYKQLPLNMYQIQAKFRDEIRPRFGLMRGREFIMKDAYSFHADDESLRSEYQNMFDTYNRIFTRLGLKFRPVEADNGSIGGSSSHEFHVLADSGEDLIAHCTACDYAANVERAESERDVPCGEAADLNQVSTPGASSIEEVAAFLAMQPELLVKTLVYRVIGGEHDGQCIAVCLRGDDQIQEIKLTRTLQADEVIMASDEDIQSIGGISGYVGPVGLKANILADASLQGSQGLVAGANQADMHLTGLDMARDLADVQWADLRSAREGDRCPRCQQTMAHSRGIEVGHVFELGTVYSEPMEVLFQDQQGKRTVASMGCYGIGVSRLMAAVVEQCHDADGIKWPAHLAPFQAVIVSMGKSETCMQASEEIYQQLLDSGVDVLWDDRKERPGVKFKDAELMGIPMQLIIGDRSLENGVVELRQRTQDKQEVPVAESVQSLLKWLATN